jgi:phosphoribosylglycinamide formyltransferase-1
VNGDRRLAVLISGRGSNLQSIIDAIGAGALDATIAVVVSSRPDAAGLARAREAGLETLCLEPRGFPDRRAYDQALLETIRARRGGPIVMQAAVPVLDTDTVDTLSARILVEEHRIYPQAIGLVLDGGWSVDGRRFVRRP